MTYQLEQLFLLKMRIEAKDDNEAVVAFCDLVSEKIKQIAEECKIKVEELEYEEGLLDVRLEDERSKEEGR